MDKDARKQAQQRVERIDSFRSELTELEREGALNLTQEQRSRLEAHLGKLLSVFQQQFGVDVTTATTQVSWGMRVASLLGGAALMAALVLFLRRTWGSLPLTAHVAILTAAPLALLTGAETLFARQADRYYVALLVIASGVTFMMELNALGCVLNLADSPNAVLAWGLFAMLVAYAYGLRLALAAGLVLLCLYPAALILNAQGYYWVAFPQRAQFLIPGAAAIYCVPWLTRRQGSDDFGFVYRACGAGTGLAALLLLSTAGDVCCGPFSPGTVAAVYQIVGLLLSVGVVFHGVRLGRTGLVNLGVGAFMVFLFVRLQAWWWHWMPKYLFFLLIGLTAIGLLLVFRRIRTQLREGEVA